MMPPIGERAGRRLFRVKACGKIDAFISLLSRVNGVGLRPIENTMMNVCSPFLPNRSESLVSPWPLAEAIFPNGSLEQRAQISFGGVFGQTKKGDPMRTRFSFSRGCL